DRLLARSVRRPAQRRKGRRGSPAALARPKSIGRSDDFANSMSSSPLWRRPIVGADSEVSEAPLGRSIFETDRPSIVTTPATRAEVLLRAAPATLAPRGPLRAAGGEQLGNRCHGRNHRAESTVPVERDPGEREAAERQRHRSDSPPPQIATPHGEPVD